MELHSFILFTTIHYSSLQGLINAVNITLCICKIQFNIITVTYKSRTFPDVIWILGKQSVRFRRNVLYSASKSTWPRNVADCEDTVYLFSARGYYILSRECLRIFETSETLKQRHKGTSQKTLNCYPDKCLRFWFFSFSSDFQFFIFSLFSSIRQRRPTWSLLPIVVLSLGLHSCDNTQTCFFSLNKYCKTTERPILK